VFSVTNEELGIQQLCRKLEPADLVILEATGGLEVPVASALATAGIAVAIVNPRQVRDFARATGRLAKTDRLDAEVLARFGELVKPAVRPLADEQAQALEALITRRRQLVEMLTAEKNRRSRAPKVLYRSIDEHIRWLEKRLSGLDEELGTMIRDTPLWRERDELLRSVPGVGNVLSSTLIAHLPSWERSTASRSPPWPASRRLIATAAACAAAVASGAGALRFDASCIWQRWRAFAVIRPSEPSICGCVPVASMPNLLSPHAQVSRYPERHASQQNSLASTPARFV
jgi:transposase